MLEAGEGPVRLDGDRLVVGRDTGDDLHASVERLKGLVVGVLPEVELTEVVIALDAAREFSTHLLHSAGAKARSPAMLTHLYAAILAQATNLGPVAMARATGLSYDQVAHATAWYLREETLVAAIDEVINYHHGLAASRRWGDGTFSSSDGQRFPVQVKAANAGALPRHFGFGNGISVLTWVSDHYATFGTKVIRAGAREGLFALDEIFALRERDSESRHPPPRVPRRRRPSGQAGPAAPQIDKAISTSSPHDAGPRQLRRERLAPQHTYRGAHELPPELEHRLLSRSPISGWDGRHGLAVRRHDGPLFRSTLAGGGPRVGCTTMASPTKTASIPSTMPLLLKTPERIPTAGWCSAPTGPGTSWRWSS